MSQETSQWLNTMTLIGFTTKRGKAWHYRESDQGQEPNHYPLAIPIEDVRRRLFNWKAIESDVKTTLPDGEVYTDRSRKSIMRDDTFAVLGVFKDGYQIHQYEETLLGKVELLLEDELSIGSAGLLRQGGQAWVQVEVPENITTPEGVEFRPHLTASTSLDGSLATTFGRAVTATVCDNTLAVAIRSFGDQKVKIRHSRYSHLKLQDARSALAIVHETADEFAAQVAELCNTTVSEGDWNKFLDSLAPVPTEDGRAKTNALNKRDALTGLWESDSRVAPWKGTAFGVVQAMNTFTHHVGSVKGDRAERNASRAITGGVERLDTETFDRLMAVMA